MKELHPIGWYAARISPRLPEEAFKPVPARLMIGLYDLYLWICLIIALLLGAGFAGMGILGHEILHQTVVRQPWLQEWLGAIAFFPFIIGPKLWRKWHNATHHVHTQKNEQDPDSLPTLEKLDKSRFLRKAYLLPSIVRSCISFSYLMIGFNVHSSRMFVRFMKQFNRASQLRVWLQFIVPWATWITLLFLMGFEKWFFAFLLPLFIGNFILMAYISTNHFLNPYVPVNDPLANSLTVTVPKWVDVLHFNFSYHTEHHIFPGISSKYYPLVKQHIKTMWPDQYHEMPMGQALKALWETPRIYYKYNELIDPRENHVYGSLGNGLDPAYIRYRKIILEKEEESSE
ncbi:fatty acid desaturase family protein [Paenibacillus montanisoli]|uniref:Acyl-CoA desaturase n=1 Tax=Paenibacillus montanisoli TaxID=2081970 RepID=A0A328U3A0_9BACL|nr:acyl-CoA desaturase [Paenibacillus montanisoli]RAP77297.1 acyl-CoA desaturase [Paenibacillus montanisoli]